MCVAGIAVPQGPTSSSNVLIQVVGSSAWQSDTNCGIWLTTNAGATWTQTKNHLMFWGNGSERVGGEPVIFNPGNDLEVWAGTHTNGLWESVDGGNSWSQVAAVANSNIIASMYIHPSHPDNIWMAGDGGVWVSTNHGANWSAVYTSPTAVIYKVTGAPDGTIYFGGNTGSSTHVLQKVTTANWGNPSSYVLTDLTAAYGNDTDALSCVTVLRNGWVVASDYGLCKISTNGGTNFSNVGKALVPGTLVPQWISPGKTVVYLPTCLVQDVFATNTWYSSFGWGAARTDDGGQTWQYTVNGVGEVCTVKVGFHPTDPNRIGLTCGDVGGAIVTDGGLSGNTVCMIKSQPVFSADGMEFSHRALISSNNGVNRYIFLGAEEYNNRPRIYATTNDGTSWYYPGMVGLPTNTNGACIVEGVASPDNPDDYLVVCGGPGGTNQGGVYRTINGGNSFTQCNWYPNNTDSLGNGAYWFVWLDADATNMNVRYLFGHVTFPSNPTISPYTNTGGGFFVSYDRGVNWTQLTGSSSTGALIPGDWSDWTGQMSADHGVSGSIWVALQTSSGTHGLAHSYNGGTNFYAVPGFVNAKAVDAFSNNVAVYGAMTGDGWMKIYYSTNNGTNFSEVTTNGYRCGNTVALALDPHRPGRIFAGTQERSVTIFTPGTPVQQWRMNYFLTTSNAGSAANWADPNGNGVPNLVEYALGGDPMAGAKGDPLGSFSSNASSYLPCATISTNPPLAGQPALRLNLPDPPPSDIKLQVLSSSDLVTWSTNATRTGTNAWQWLGSGSSLVAPGLDTNGRAIFDLGTPAGSWSGQFQRLQVITN